MTKKCYSYIRFSTKVQAKGTSKERQWNVAREYADRQGYELIESNYSDLGVSGWKAVHRTGLQNMLDAIETGAIPSGSVIVIEAVDRLSRKQYQETNDLVQSIVSSGVELYVDADNMLYNSSTVNDIDKIMMLAIRCKIAFEESEQKSIRVQKAKDAKKQQAREGKKTKKLCPKWLTFNEQTNEFEFNDYAEAIRFLVNLKLNGGTENTITKDMNDSPYKPPRATEWNPTSIRRILSSHALYGAWMTSKKLNGKWVDDELILNHYPALVTFEEFQILTPKKRVVNSGKGSVNNHFSRLARCSKCDSVMTKKTTVNKYGTYVIYRCNNAAKRLGCDAPAISAKQLEKLVFAYSRQLKVKDPKPTSEQDAIKQQIQQKQIALKQVQRAISNGGDVTALISASIDLESGIKALDKQLIPQDDTAANLKSLFNSIHEPTKWNNLAHRFIKTIYVDVNGESRKRKYLKICIVEHSGKVTKSTVFGKGRHYEWADVDQWIK
ncbi:recombinase family protein [Vibrio sp. D420a]|uniref:recombinase family protein n=1 Tax=Vibrio sp. D420a TaxID=2836895 RepID=UPI002557208E|nr:recombinase family protein [Vibrio sp. D420a]MDK9763954.1 recombinase family protein [Vibrio sp. D420a]